MKKQLFTLCLVLFSVNIAHSQTKQDTYEIENQFSKGNYYAVIRLADELLKHYPAHAELFYMKGVAAQAVFRYKLAQPAFEKAKELEPNNSKYNNTLGKFYLENGKVDLAEKLFSEFYRKDTLNLNVRLTLANVYQQIEQYEKAFDLYTKVLNSDSTNVVLINKVAFCHLKMGKTRKSINSYKKAIQLVPDYLPSYKMLSFVYSKLERYDTAVAVLDDAIKLDSTDIDLYRRRGDVWHKQEYHFRCMPNYRKAYQMGDSSLNLTKRIALDLVSDKMFDEALIFCEKAYQLDSSDAEICLKYAFTCQKLNQNEKAERLYYRGLERLGGFLAQAGSAYSQLAELYKDKKEFSKAVEAYQKCLGLTQYDMVYYYNIAKTYDESLKDKANAIVWYQKLMANIDKHDPSGQQFGEWKKDIQKRVNFLKKKN